MPAMLNVGCYVGFSEQAVSTSMCMLRALKCWQCVQCHSGINPGFSMLHRLRMRRDNDMVQSRDYESLLEAVSES